MILAGDIGGTKTALALFDAERATAPLFERRYFNHEQSSLVDLLWRFLNEADCPVRAACLAVAGPVREGRCEMPNLPWVVDVAEVREALGLIRVALINDLEATAHGMLTLPPERLAIINSGHPDPTGNLALIAAGTGLGEAILFRDGGGYRVSASEGGHTDFAPHDAAGIDLFRYLQARFGHVSWERVVSGPGLANLYDFLSLSRYLEEAAAVTERIAAGEDRSAAIAEAALEGESPRANLALDWFVRAYGAEAGNLALKTMATGGVYIGGGIAPKLASRLQAGDFVQAFRAKGRFAGLMSEIPVRLILEPRTALLGAAAYINQAVVGPTPSPRPEGNMP